MSNSSKLMNPWKDKGPSKLRLPSSWSFLFTTLSRNEEKTEDKSRPLVTAERRSSPIFFVGF